MEKQNRFRSWALWVAIAALVVYTIKMVWGIDVSKQVSDLMDVLLPVVVGLGVINNPTDPTHL